MKLKFGRYLEIIGSSNNKIMHNNINSKRIALFISIPKNASKTVLDILKLGPNRDEENTTSLIIYENHQRAAVLNQKYNLKSLFVFCFSRNPYDRCVSWYFHHRNIEPYKSLTFDSWIKRGMPHHWDVQNQTDYLTLGISPLLQYNFVEQYKVDFIGRLENFSNDLNSINRKLNVICKEILINYKFKQIKTKNLNKSKRKREYENYYNQKTKDIVYTLLMKDFQHFGYKK